LQQIKPFNTDVSPRKVSRSNHRRRIAPSDPSPMKPSGQIQVPRSQNGEKTVTSINLNIGLNDSQDSQP
jgi:hypothetical protein